MQRRVIIIAGFTVFILLCAFRYVQKPGSTRLKYISSREILKNKLAFNCAPYWKHLDSDSLSKGIDILKGWGHYQWNINSKSDSARLYFQQGVSMYYSFHIIEAMASFKKAQYFDSTNAMIFWGQALAYGPNINDNGYSSVPEAFSAAQKALMLSGGCSKKEKILINAIAVRYASDTAVSRDSLNQWYTNEMRKGYMENPNDADIAALYADAMMLQHPWDLWNHDGGAKPWTPAILEVLEKAIKQSSLHPGANHYYIHAVEASGAPQRALPSANLLSKMMPSVSHMVHMPSHIYIRTGFYTEGMKVNELSVKGYHQYLSVYPDVVNGAPLYLIHNLHMQASCAMMGGGYLYGAKAAAAARASFDTSYLSLPSPFGDFVQYVYMTPVINNVRFGKWDTILNEPQTPVQHAYANVLWHWARGIALARKNNITEAKKELQHVQEKKDQPAMLVIMHPFNAPVDAANVAEKLLAGIIAEQEGKLAEAADLFAAAVKNEDAMIYNEPKDWMLPARPYLGAVLLKKGSYLNAENIFREDLKENPNNHWSMKGLYESLVKQGKNSAADLVKKQLAKAIATNDMKKLPVVF